MAFYSATLLGVQPLPVEIEIDLSPGLPFFQIVGLPDAILKESKTRVKSAIVQADFEFPHDQRLVLNLAPSKIRKEGSGFELALAARILSTSGQIPMPEGHTLFLGELALDGSVKSVPEVEALAYAAQELQCLNRLVVAADAWHELPPLPCPVVAIGHLRELKRDDWWRPTPALVRRSVRDLQADGAESFSGLEFSPFWARHLEIAAVGGHHYFLCGPPGCGKTFFAESLKTLLPLAGRENSSELKVLNAIFKRSPDEVPWAAPHHSATSVGLVGGGAPPRPGAVTRAHGGVLFLDELLEFSGAVLDSLREPLEKGWVEVYRAGQGVVFPSRFQMVGCTNPCRCGYWLHPLKSCVCPPYKREVYQARMSGPLFDRFDVKVICQPSLDHVAPVTGATILKRVREALSFKNKNENFSWSTGASWAFESEKCLTPLNLRVTKKIKMIAHTLAMLDGTSEVSEQNVLEAFLLQSLKGLDGKDGLKKKTPLEGRL